MSYNYQHVQVITLYQVLMNMSENYMTVLEVLVSFRDSLATECDMRTSRLRFKVT